MQIILRVFTVLCLFISLEAISFDGVKGQIVEHAPKSLPEFPLYDLKGQEVLLDSLEGNVVILHFWASWCTQCASEMQKLNHFQKLVRKEPVIVIPVSEDFRNIEKIKEFYKENHLRHLLSFVDKDQKWFNALSLNSLPVSLVLNGHMEHIATIQGVFDWNSPDNIARLKSFILRKEVANPDYTDLLGKQENMPKESVIEVTKPEKKEIPESAITNVAPLDIEKDAEHINVTNVD